LPVTPDSTPDRALQIDDPIEPWDRGLDPETEGAKLRVVFLVDGSGANDKLVAIWRDGDDLKIRDVTNPGTDNKGYSLTQLLAGSGLTEGAHKALRQLIHFMSGKGPGDGFGSGPYASGVLPEGDPFPTSETWYATAADKAAGTGKIARQEWTYNTNKTLATEKWIVYKSDGTSEAATATDTISYSSGVFETGRSRAIAVY